MKSWPCRSNLTEHVRKIEFELSGTQTNHLRPSTLTRSLENCRMRASDNINFDVKKEVNKMSSGPLHVTHKVSILYS